MQRGVSLGSFPATSVQYWDMPSRLRVLVKALLLPFLCFVIGSLVYSSGDARLGAGLLVVGVIAAIAAILDFRTLWEVALPKPEAGSTVIKLRKPGDPVPVVVSYPSQQRTILLRKPDVVTLLGFWPADVRKDRQKA